ncbi:alpha/beta fold hydrolase [Corallococcus exiguus]|uniref:Alpha/beta fold hydrolase n=1 Tax=Corallococcus exiguus TaxID=83462 RepID=A0A7X4Y6A5_9BACT|nr:alpha/beta fold hydrolase [Corallococcus exiguus]NBC39460.1 alpha/beta fold hydrolase [Corallococcus exiguus]TNV59856.1 alpha/beta fold hydrolase [Corallococcus exiguus]
MTISVRRPRVLLSVLLGLSLGCATARPQAASAPVETTVSASEPLVAQEADAVFTSYRFQDGAVLPEVRIHYATLGTPRRDASGAVTNAVLLLHWTSASGEVLRSKSFQDALFAPGRPLDATKYLLIFPDSVGHGRSSKPSDGLRTKFPAYGYRDMVELQHQLVTRTLGIRRLHAIVGLSMGGMNAWQWSELYPDAVEGVMPIVSLPTRIAGRNLLWRRFVSGQIRNDPEWKDGLYTAQPRGWLEAFPVFRMMLDGVPHLQATLPDAQSADAFIATARAQAAGMDANDILYSLESSRDYDPEGALGDIQAHVFALNFSDDEFNPVTLRTLETLMPRVKRGRFVVQEGSASSFGHFTQAHPELWADQVAAFLKFLEEG